MVSTSIPDSLKVKIKSRFGNFNTDKYMPQLDSQMEDLVIFWNTTVINLMGLKN